MMRLMRAPDLMLGQHWVNLLRQAGIACRLTGLYLQGGGRDPGGPVRPGPVAGRRARQGSRDAPHRGAGRGGHARALALRRLRRMAGAAIHDLLAMRRDAFGAGVKPAILGVSAGMLAGWPVVVPVKGIEPSTFSLQERYATSIKHARIAPKLALALAVL